MLLSCGNCVHSPVCRLLKGEMDARFLAPYKGDIIKAVNKLREELAQTCRFYGAVRIDG